MTSEVGCDHLLRFLISFNFYAISVPWLFKLDGSCRRFQLPSLRKDTLVAAVKSMSLQLSPSKKMRPVPLVGHVSVQKNHKPPSVYDCLHYVLEAYQDGKISLGNFSDCEVHPNGDDPLGIDWIFTVDTLNFCFWNPKAAHWEVTWRNKKYTGYYALCAAIWRSIDEGTDLRDPKVYSKLNLKDLKHIFRSDEGSGDLLLVEERLECLHQVGKVLLDKFKGSFKTCVEKAQNSALKLLDLVVSEFPCYQDEAIYKGRKVSFYKRAQILIADLWLWFKDEGIGHFPDINSITMFADYRVPQVLVHFGVLEYSSELYEILKKDTILESKCDKEIEIRGCSIEAVEQISSVVKAKLGDGDKTKLNSILIDNFLWDYRRAHAKELEYIPYHKVISIFY